MDRVELTPEVLAAACSARELGYVKRTDGAVSMSVSECIETEHFDTLAKLCRQQHEALEMWKTHLELKTLETLIWAEEATEKLLTLWPDDAAEEVEGCRRN